jgi:hypothetical protein
MECVKCLVEAGAYVNAIAPESNSTPLEVAHKGEFREMENYLKDYGAEPPKKKGTRKS